jgi:spermidine synthase
VLVLGLGGGSAARVARALAPRARIVGVERDGEVLAAARQAFELDDLDLEVVHDDARAFLACERRRYDLVIDDVFVGRGWHVRKPDWLPEPGLDRMRARLAVGGLLVCNAIDEARAVGTALRRRLPACVGVDIAGYDNRIWVGGPTGLDARSLRRAAATEPLFAETLPRLRMRTWTAR